MGRRRKWPPSILPHKRSGRDRCRIDGEEYWLGPSGSEEAKREYARILAEHAGAAPAPLPPPGVKAPHTVADVVLWFEAEELSRYDPAGKEPEGFRRSAEVLLALFGESPADAFRAQELRQVRKAMVAKGWARSTINRRITRLKTMWRRAEENGLVREGAWAHLLIVKPLAPNDRQVKQTEPVLPASWEDVKLLLPFLAPAPQAMLLVQWFTGCRSKEVRRMRAGEVHRAGEEWVFRPPAHKNAWRGQAREVPIGPRARLVLRAWLEGKSATEWVFPAVHGRRRKSRKKVYRGERCYRDDSYARAVARAAEKAGVSLHPYQCRHAMRVRAEEIAGLDGARAALGQKSVESTARYGQQNDLGKAASLARKLG